MFKTLEKAVRKFKFDRSRNPSTWQHCRHHTTTPLVPCRSPFSSVNLSGLTGNQSFYFYRVTDPVSTPIFITICVSTSRHPQDQFISSEKSKPARPALLHCCDQGTLLRITSFACLSIFVRPKSVLASDLGLPSTSKGDTSNCSESFFVKNSVTFQLFLRQRQFFRLRKH